jgi:hypothetical protein
VVLVSPTIYVALILLLSLVGLRNRAWHNHSERGFHTLRLHAFAPAVFQAIRPVKSPHYLLFPPCDRLKVTLVMLANTLSSIEQYYFLPAIETRTDCEYYWMEG